MKRKRKRTPEQTWSKCIRMWRWIVAQIVKNPDADVVDLKCQWFSKHDPYATVAADCYFCEWVLRYSHGNNMCHSCPAYLVDKDFHCGNPAYNYEIKPAAFLAKIEELNKRRKAQLQSRKKGKATK